MNTLSIDAWCKTNANEKSTPIGLFRFFIDEETHLRLEKAEKQLEDSQETEVMVAANMDSLALETSEECGPLSDCKIRVYLDKTFHRGQFHLVGQRSSDDSHVYTNAVMIDQLG